MSLASKSWVAMTCLLLSAGCVKGASIENDEGSSRSSDDDDEARDAGRRDAGGSTSTRRDASSPSSDDDDGDEAAGDGDDDMSLPDGGTGSGRDGGRDAGGGGGDDDVEPVEIAGTAKAAKCTSTTPAADGMCSSHFCGITEAQLATAFSKTSPCGTAALACEQGALLAKKVTDCSITVKAMATNLGKSNDQLRPAVQDCVYEDAEIKENTNDECLGCFLDVAECAGDKCLTECLVGTPAQCDACRISKGCEEPLFDCAGLPNPL